MKRKTAWFCLAAACLLSWSTMAQARERAATITILDGQALVIRGSDKLAVAEGARIDAEDIVETPASAALLRLEMPDGTILDLGPASRVMVRPPLARGVAAPVAYVLQGWAKLSSGPTASLARPLLASPAVDVAALSRDVVLQVQGAEAGVFAEAGTVRLQVLNGAGKPATMNLRRGQFLRRGADGVATTSQRPGPDFIAAVPRDFMDTLPSRLALYAGHDKAPKLLGHIAYEDARDWLNAEPRVRRQFLTRWRAMAHDGAFRHGLEAQLGLHPEWRPILYPPPPPPPPKAKASERATP